MILIMKLGFARSVSEIRMLRSRHKRGVTPDVAAEFRKSECPSILAIQPAIVQN
jgi:hypothetical protein